MHIVRLGIYEAAHISKVAANGFIAIQRVRTCAPSTRTDRGERQKPTYCQLKCTMCSKTPQNTPNPNTTVKMSPRAPHCCHTPQRPIPAYYTSLVSSLDTLGPTNFEFVHNRIKVSVDDLYIFCDFCIFAFFAKVLDFEGLSMETFIRLWPILNFDSPRAPNELTNEV